MKFFLLAALFGLSLLVSSARAQFQSVFMIGQDNATQTEFEQETASLIDYYWENDNYATVGGLNWSSGMEPWNNAIAGDTVGFPRALLHPGTSNTQTNIFFHLDAAEAGPNQPLRLTLDIIGLKANTTHDLDVRLNQAAPFASRAAIAGDTTWVINTTAGAAGAVAGPNVLRVRRTGGAIDAGSAWIQFDYIRMESDTSAQYINTFTTNDALLRPGETATLSWTLFEPAATVSISPGIGDVTPLTINGNGSINVTPAANTTYTLTATHNSIIQTRTVTVNTSAWEGIFELGVDNNVNTEFSHEVAADDDYYFAGNYTSIGGPNQAANELLNDDTDTNTAAGRTGNPAIGFERAVTEFDPQTNIWFIPAAAQADVTARHRISVDVLSVGSGGGGAQTHNIEISLNGQLLRQENAITGPRLIQFEVNGITDGMKTGPNSLTLRRTGGTLAGFVVFDYVMLEYLPGTLPTITGVTDDAILGTHTVAWTAQVAKTYRVQKSTDAGASWQNMASGFPTGGAPSTSLFYEDRVTPFTDPRPTYRVLQE
ncbi:MAG TPA: hypothetical protein VG796_03685 [Verrucomicrobiales bacterium]|nr:hypothetical protein [Verrucomicrobiales bacterium]